MNTSMTINATAMWLLALYQVAAEEQGTPAASPAGTTQNDIIKEYLSRGTYVFPPGPSLRLITDMVAYTVTEIPKWNPINICSYHLQEVGATPVQEIAYALAPPSPSSTRSMPPARCQRRSSARSSGASPSSSTRASASSKRSCKMRAFDQLWDQLTLDRYGVTDQAPSLPLRRAGQLPRPDRGAAGEQRPAHRAGDAGRHAVQGRPRPRRAAARPGTRRSACPVRGTNSGRCACSRSWPTRPTCSSTRTCSTAPSSSRPTSRSSGRGQEEVDRGPGDGWGGRGRRVRLHEVRPGRIACRAPSSIEAGEEKSSASTSSPPPRTNPLLADVDAAIKIVDPAVEAARHRAVQAWRAEREPRLQSRRLAAARRRQRPTQPHDCDPRLRPRGRDDGGVGRCPA